MSEQERASPEADKMNWQRHVGVIVATGLFVTDMVMLILIASGSRPSGWSTGLSMKIVMTFVGAVGVAIWVLFGLPKVNESQRHFEEGRKKK